MTKLTLPLIATFAYNTAIAGLLTATGWMAESCGFGCNFVFSQSIGFSIAIISSLTLARLPAGRLRWAALAGVLPLSVAVGLSLGFALTGIGGWSHSLIWQAMLIGLFFGLLASITFVLIERIGLLNATVKDRQLQVAEQDKRAMEAHLKLLQAQIEPHFLFNTLANVNSLIDSDPVAASLLLDRLNEWLRAALAQARSDAATLGDELTMLENYLHILKTRFDERLRWQVDCAEDLRALPFPPMLLQPLVENAVRHGIEPKLGGGEIYVYITREQNMLHLLVSDSGAGLGEAVCEGAGLSNVRARVAALYGEAGNLSLKTNAVGGATAHLTLPVGTNLFVRPHPCCTNG